MGLHFENLPILDSHIKYLSKKINSDNIFLVGWCIRDILLGITKDPQDIDITMAWNPTSIYKKIDKKGISHFITEKFGTITLLEKDKVDWIKYELTPLRTEGWYEDFRHPWEINRSNDVVLDSNRRDFSINCIYYFSTSQAKITKEIKKTKIADEESLVKILTREWFVFLPNLNTFIIQDHKHISKLFEKWKFQIDYFNKLQNELKENIIELKQSDKNIKSNKSIKFIVDPHQWINDIFHKKIKTVWSADNRFGEDALRIVRWLRFVNILNSKLKDYYSNKSNPSQDFFDFEKATWLSIKKNHNLVTKVAKERLKEELTKVFKNNNPFWFIALLDEVWLIKFFFPALYETKFVTQPVRYHPFDIYTHILLTLFELQKTNTNYLAKLAILYHDVGKVQQFKSYKDWLSQEEIREILSWPLNHRKGWPTLVKRDFSKLWFSKKEIEEISRYVGNHHKPEEVLYAKKENQTKKTRKFLSECWYERAQNILDICIADRMWQYNPLQTWQDTWAVYELKWALEKMHKAEWEFTATKLVINGKDIIKHFKIKAWPIVWDLLSKALDRAMNDIKKRNNKEKILKYLQTYIKQKK